MKELGMTAAKILEIKDFGRTAAKIRGTNDLRMAAVKIVEIEDLSMTADIRRTGPLSGRVRNRLASGMLSDFGPSSKEG